MPTRIERFGWALVDNAGDFGVQLKDIDVQRLSNYYELLLKWNDRLHLVAPCSPEEFATRHVLESLLLLRHLTSNARVVDVGSGGGLPIVPCLIIRNDLHATLIESSQKKGVFLREALRGVPSREQARLTVTRFEKTVAPEAEFITCRALDRLEAMLPTLVNWAPTKCSFLLFAGVTLRRQVEVLLPSASAEPIPKSERRYLLLAKRITPA